MTKIVVHGVHRSGTSFWASLLEKAGCWYAEDEYKMLPQKDNLKGFWERTDVVELNDRLLAELNLNWFTLNPSIQEQRYTELKQVFEEQIIEVVHRLEKHDNWFLKDPRLSMTWTLWSDHLKPTHHLVVHRHPISVAKSLNRRNGVSIHHGLIFWYHQTRMIAKSLVSQNNVLNVQFDAQDGVAEQYDSILNGLFNDDPNYKKLELEDINALFESKLINHQYTNEEVLDQETLKVYEIVSKAWGLAVNGEFQKLLNLPEFETADFSWHELDSSYTTRILNQKLEREIAQYQSEVKGYSNQITEFSDKFDSERNILNSHIKSLDVEILTQGKDIKSLLKKFRSSEEEQLKLKGLLSLSDENIKLQQDTIKLQQDTIKLQQDTIDELNHSLLSIAGLLKRYMNSKRYFVFNGFNKAIAKLKLCKHRSLHDALDIAKFGHSSSDLDSVMPKASTQLLLAKTIVQNPKEFIRRMNVQRLKKGLKVILGKGESDIATQQALLQYHDSDISNNAKLDIFDPEDMASWLDESLEFHSETSPQVSIVIPVYNNYSTTLACLHSIKKHTDINISYEVIIADDCSSDQTRDIELKVSGVNVVRPNKNLGFLQNCNHAMQKAKGEFVVLLNNDTNVQTGWLSELLNPFETDSQVGVTGPMFLYPDGRLQEAGGIVFEDASGWNYGRFDHYEKPEYNFSREVDYVSGACLVFRKSLWDKIGGFDELFIPAYYEDTDFCFVTRSLGLKVKYIPTAKVVHFEGVSHGSSEDAGIKKYQLTNKENFFQKWGKTLRNEHCSGPDELFKARFHGKHKKTLLFIDHYVPFYDKDAGSKVAQRYIELLVEQGVHVIFLGDNFYPHQPYTDELQRLGVEVLFGEFYKNNWFEWLQQNSTQIDAIYLNRPHISEQYIDKIRTLEHIPHLAYHGADLHYVRVGREETLGVKDDEGRTAEQWKKVEYDLMKECDISLWLSNQEVDLIRKEDSSINVDYKPMYWFDELDVLSEINVVNELNILFVGGFGHPPNLDGLTWFLEQVYPTVIAKYPQVKLSVIGSNCPDEVKKLESDNVKILGFVSEEELIDAYSKARLSIVPLRYGAGVKGKVIESMQYGVAVLTTEIGAEGLPGNPSNYLTIADEASEFAEQLLLMLENDDICESKISKSNAVLKKYFSKQSAVQAINKIIGQPFKVIKVES